MWTMKRKEGCKGKGLDALLKVKLQAVGKPSSNYSREATSHVHLSSSWQQSSEWIQGRLRVEPARLLGSLLHQSETAVGESEHWQQESREGMTIFGRLKREQNGKWNEVLKEIWMDPFQGAMEQFASKGKGRFEGAFEEMNKGFDYGHSR